ncbi:ADP-ribosylation factor protein 3 [Orbilia brochopaga]|uniref:ADP-ribosylation factor protein 3 n=1 Tax=Orbilia brochopaga TaxID=3140254 RepID=A0AAV9V595_9PEZI
MYHLFKGLYYYATTKEEYSILLLGLDNAGKTTLLEKIKSIYLSHAPAPRQGAQPPTVGQNMSTIPLPSPLPPIYLKIWDIGGQESLRNLWTQYYTSSHAIVFVVDSTDKARIEECRDVLEIVVDAEDTEGIPILMLANKQDREESLEVEEIKEVFNKIAERLSARDSRVLPISALTGTGVKESVEWLVTRIMRNKEYRPPLMR